RLSILLRHTGGPDPALLFLHGAGGNHLSWWQQVPVFSEEYRCVTLDQRGFGRSPDVPGGSRHRCAGPVRRDSIQRTAVPVTRPTVPRRVQFPEMLLTPIRDRKAAMARPSGPGGSS